MCRILFLYATNNSGHQKAAEAIKGSIKKIAPHVATAEIGFFSHNYPHLGPFLFKMYVDIMRYLPHAYDYIYDNPDIVQMTAEFRQFFRLLNLPKLHKVLRDYRPNLIVCTQAIPAGFIAAEKERGSISIPMLAAITDFVANPYWPDRHVDCYFVPAHEIKQQLIQRRIPAESIQVTGIPINASFHHKSAKTLARQRLGLKPGVATVLIMGGSHGLGQIYEAVEQLSSLRLPLQMIIVTGHNRPLYHALKKHYDNDSLLILTLVKNIAGLMDAADLFIGKPGGLTTAEAMAKGLPIVILAPLPGQEERNASYIVQNGIGERCDSIHVLPRMVESFIAHPQKLRRFSRQAIRLSHPHASDAIADHLLKYIERIPV